MFVSISVGIKHNLSDKILCSWRCPWLLKSGTIKNISFLLMDVVETTESLIWHCRGYYLISTKRVVIAHARTAKHTHAHTHIIAEDIFFFPFINHLHIRKWIILILFFCEVCDTNIIKVLKSFLFENVEFVYSEGLQRNK